MEIKRLEKDDEDGLIGIGTLIIFIALILVSAVAASLMISTVKTIKQQAEKTAQQSLEEVSNSFQIQSVYGYKGPASKEINTVLMRVKLMPGSSSQNLSYTLLHIDDGETEKGLEYNSSGISDQDHFSAVPLMDPVGEFKDNRPVINQGTIVKIEINATAVGLNLTTQRECRIELTPKHGTSTIEIFTTPSVYDSRIIHFG